MSIEEKIKEEANLYANKGVYVNTNDRQVGLRGYGESSFVAGANFALEEAFRWIPVQERLPYLMDDRKCMDVLIKYKSRCSKNPMISVRIDTFGIPYDRNNPDFFMNQRMHEYEVTHWRPIYLEDL